MGWESDPSGQYDLRWMEVGRPTAWVMHQGGAPVRDSRFPQVAPPPYVATPPSSPVTPGRDSFEAMDAAAAITKTTLRTGRAVVKANVWLLKKMFR